MSYILTDEIGTSEHFGPARDCYKNLFVEGGRYVFEGNRVTAHLRPVGNGHDGWCLETIDATLYFAIGHDLRVHEYRRVEDKWAIRTIAEFQTALDAIMPLDDAICDCAQHGHAWSPTQYVPNCAGNPYTWQWCLLCGIEQVWFPYTGEWLQWPEDAAEIGAGTAGALPTLHGAVVGVIATSPPKPKSPVESRATAQPRSAS